MAYRVRNLLFRGFRAMETRVHELNYLFWECTTRCCLHCLHCGSDCGMSAANSDMPIADFLKAFDTIPREKIAKPFTVVFTGGEPLMRSDIADAGLELRKRGVGWGVVTNGWLYDRDMHRQLMAAGLGALTISLDGIEGTHDWMRGRTGSYSRALDAIAIAASDGRLHFDVVTCVNRRNLPQLQAIYDLLASIGVPQWRLFTVIPIGRALQNSDMQLSDAEFVRLMDFIGEKRRTNGYSMNVTFGCEGYLGRYEMRVRQTPYFCHAGINIASVLIDGTICACPNIDRQAFGQGNIYEDNLWDVWQRGFKPFRDRSWARKGKCKGCSVFKYCLGNGMHNWHGDCGEVINCHYRKTVS